MVSNVYCQHHILGKDIYLVKIFHIQLQLSFAFNLDDLLILVFHLDLLALFFAFFLLLVCAILYILLSSHNTFYKRKNVPIFPSTMVYYLYLLSPLYLSLCPCQHPILVTGPTKLTLPGPYT